MFESSHHQVAGHGGALDYDYVYAKPADPREVDFYQTLVARDLDTREAVGPPLGDVLCDWTPQYYGTLSERRMDDAADLAAMMEVVQVADEAPSAVPEGRQYLVLSNLYHFYRRPSILDVKLGAVLHDELASPEKAQRLAAVSRDTTSGSLGFRVCGMKVFSPHEGPDLSPFPGSADHVAATSDSYVVFDKWFGRALTKDNVAAAIELFFTHNLHGDLLHRVLVNFHRRLQLLYNCILSYNVRIVSSSLLFILEADPAVLQEVSADLHNYRDYDPLINELQPDDDEDDEFRDKIVTVSSLNLIDFAHARFVKSKEPDHNLLNGIANLINLFEHLVAKYTPNER